MAESIPIPVLDLGLELETAHSSPNCPAGREEVEVGDRKLFAE